MENSSNISNLQVRSALFTCVHALVSRSVAIKERLIPSLLHLLHNFEFLCKPLPNLVADIAQTHP
eukprot:1370956-Amorphochlora_amoeboformis.AAC.1